MSINLLPNHQKDNGTQGLIITLVIGLIVIVGVAVIGGDAYFWFDNRTLADTLQLKKDELTQVNKEIGQTKPAQQELAYIIDRGNSYATYEAQNAPYVKMLDTIAKATPAKLEVTNLVLKPGADVAISGVAATRNDIAAFTEGLSQATTYFSGVTLNGTDNQSDGVHFSISAQLVGVSVQSTPTATPASQSGESSL